jgi:hypothetical protein
MSFVLNLKIKIRTKAIAKAQMQQRLKPINIF